MVVAHPSCPSKCIQCLKDCICPVCRACHWCACRKSHQPSLFGGSSTPQPSRLPNSATQSGFFTHSTPSLVPHACTSYTAEIQAFTLEKSKLEAEKGKLEAENAKEKVQVAHLTSEIASLKKKNAELESARWKSSADKLSATRLLNHFVSDTISVLVGPKRKRFVLHIDAITAASKYFKEMFLTGSTRDRPKDVILDGEIYDVDTFGMFVEYCYLGTYFNDGHEGSHFIGNTPQSLVFHARVYAIADELMCSQLRDLALRKATDWCHGYSIHKNEDTSRGAFSSALLDAIRIVYSYTIDPDAGSLPSSLTIAQDLRKRLVFRDGFRLLLAHLTATNLTDLRRAGNFLEMHYNLPDFNTDMLLFMKNGENPSGNEIKTNNSSIPTVPASQIDEKYTKIQRVRLLGLGKFVSTEMITVLVGEAAQRFILHTSAIECSGYFRGMVSSNMVEMREKIVCLTDEVDTPEAFEGFVQYCYFHDYLVDGNRAHEFEQHARVYVLADRLSCPGLKDLALTKAEKMINEAYLGNPSELFVTIPSIIAVIYRNTYDKWAEKLSRAASLSKSDTFFEVCDGVNSNRKQTATNIASHVVPLGQTSIAGPSPQKGDSAKQTNTTDRERFRMLISRFASVHISRLRQQAPFVAMHHAFPDFAADVMLLATAGNAMQFDGDGKLKLPSPDVLSPP